MEKKTGWNRGYYSEEQIPAYLAQARHVRFDIHMIYAALNKRQVNDNGEILQDYNMRIIILNGSTFRSKT